MAHEYSKVIFFLALQYWYVLIYKYLSVWLEHVKYGLKNLSKSDNQNQIAKIYKTFFSEIHFSLKLLLKNKKILLYLEKTTKKNHQKQYVRPFNFSGSKLTVKLTAGSTPK